MQKLRDKRVGRHKKKMVILKGELCRIYKLVYKWCKNKRYCKLLLFMVERVGVTLSHILFLLQLDIKCHTNGVVFRTNDVIL